MATTTWEEPRKKLPVGLVIIAVLIIALVVGLPSVNLTFQRTRFQQLEEVVYQMPPPSMADVQAMAKVGDFITVTSRDGKYTITVTHTKEGCNYYFEGAGLFSNIKDSWNLGYPGGCNKKDFLDAFWKFIDQHPAKFLEGGQMFFDMVAYVAARLILQAP